MKYNKSFGGEPFQNYITYLETIKDRLSKNLYEFISDSKRHDLEEKSLHDSWLNKIHIEVIRDEENRNLEKSVEIEIEFLGAYHDRVFCLKFNDVFAYKFEEFAVKNCDLITYEVYSENIDEKDILVFNAEFADKHSVIIKSQNLEIIEKFIV
jgi:hypothetical protein